jgi:AraC-like DNA-binding protein/ligand-binding sensor protein
MKARMNSSAIGSFLDEIEHLTGQGAVYYGLYEETVLFNPKACAFCRTALAHPIAASLCRTACRNATVNATASGEPHFYRCWANLLFVTIPLAPQNKCRGGIEMGGFCIAGEQREIREAIQQLSGSWPETDSTMFLAHLHSVRRITASALRGLGSLVMEASFSCGLNSSDFFRRQNEHYLQQRRIAEAFADIRQQAVSPPDILGDTYQLVSFLRQNNKPLAMAFVSTYLAKLLMASNWDQTKLKAHIRVLLAVMTSQSILAGTPWAVATSRELRQMLRLENAMSTEESCYEVADWIQQYCEGTNPSRGDGRTLVERVAGWLQSHYQEHATLAAAAQAIGMSSSTLVHRIRREAGKTFKTLLTEIRIAEAKKLLATTSLELSEIANTCGFFDQSHFTRELRRAINLTPGQFRKLLRVPDDVLGRPGAGPVEENALL